VNLAATGGDVDVQSGATVDVSAGTGQGRGGRLNVTAPTGAATLAGTFKGQGGAGASGASVSVDANAVDLSSVLALNAQSGFTGDLAVRERGLGDLSVAAGTTVTATSVSLEADQGAVDIAGTIDARTANGGAIALAASGDIRVEGSLLADATGYATRGGVVELDTSAGGLYLASGSTVSVGGQGGTNTGTVWLRLPADAANTVLTAPAGQAQLQLNGAINGARQTVVEGYRSYDTQGPVFTAFANGGLIDANVTTPDPSNPIWADAAAFGANAPLIAQALGQSANGSLAVIPGIEITSTGDMTLAGTWDLSPQNVGLNGYTWRFGPNGDLPGALTLRAAGSLNLLGSLSDGFAGTYIYGGYTLQPGTGPSWSYRLVGGADLGASAPLAVQTPNALAAAGLTGDVTVAPGLLLDPNNPYGACNPICGPTVVRTGTGFIDIAAGRDVVLGNQASVVYTAGVPDTQGLSVADPESNFPGLAFPTNGGNVSISAGRDVVGAPSDQLYTDWLWRAGTNASSPSGYNPSAWSVNYGLFEQGFAAFGGGDLKITAGRDLLDVGANVPSIGMPVGDGTAAGTQIVQLASGLLDVRAGRDIAGGSYLAMGVGGDIAAGGSLRDGSWLRVFRQGFLQPINPHAPVLALGSGTLNVSAQQNLTIDTVINPTLLPRSNLQLFDPGQEFYSTYGDTGAVRLLSAGGDVTLENATQPADPIAFGSINLPIGAASYLATYWGPALRAYPPNVDAVALSGSVNVQGSMDIVPSTRGTFDLLAAQNVTVAAPFGRNVLDIVQSDLAPALLGTPESPATSTYYLQIFDTPNAYLPLAHASTPTHIDAQGVADAVPNLVVALNGDLSMQPGDTASHVSIQSAKPIEVIAGHDIIDLGLAAQNLSAGSVDLVQAGHDIVYGLSRDPATGLLNPNERTIDVAGPGAAIVVAGHTVDLGTSGGITTSGALSNAALPATGANLSVLAGVGNHLQAANFFKAYVTDTTFDATTLETYVANTLGLATLPDAPTALSDFLAMSASQQYGLTASAPGTAYGAWLMGYVGQLTGQLPTDKASALAAYATLTPTQQLGLVEQIFVSELRDGGRIAAAAGKTHNDYSRAFTALSTLFPGAEAAPGKATPTYAGDLLLYFSRVYTLQGGDIDLFAPGGQINVGLAAAPSSFGVYKDPSQLGIVAENVGSVALVADTDVQVNQSRIFAADGGNILIWSTNADIDAGRGAKTAISAPPPVITVNANGQVTQVFPAALTGSGIQALATTPGVTPGDVDLFAPHGVVNANDAGIVAGNITIGATAVLGANNISFSGTSVGVPVAVTGVGAGFSGASSTGAAASSGAASSTENSERAQKAQATELPVGMLDVAVVSLGEDDCKQDDAECLRRQKH
jgi:filamentous hemagglutinin